MKHFARLISITPRALEVSKWAWDNMHKEINSIVCDFESEQEKDRFIDTLYKVAHKTVLEFIQTVWFINGSRAFQQQLTRTRDAAYSIQSLRVVNAGTFANDGRYHIPPNLSQQQQLFFHNSMTIIQDQYQSMINYGMPVEAARGILPLNIHSPITMTINMRDLIHMMELRMCNNTQSEYRDIAADIKNDIGIILGQHFAETFFKPPCGHTGKCNSTNPCGKGFLA